MNLTFLTQNLKIRAMTLEPGTCLVRKSRLHIASPVCSELFRNQTAAQSRESSSQGLHRPPPRDQRFAAIMYGMNHMIENSIFTWQSATGQVPRGSD